MYTLLTSSCLGAKAQHENVQRSRPAAEQQAAQQGGNISDEKQTLAYSIGTNAARGQVGWQITQHVLPNSDAVGPRQTIPETRNDEKWVLFNTTNDSCESSKQESISAVLYMSMILGLCEHRLICLKQYSVFRAYTQNATFLGLDFALFAEDEAVSPLTLINPNPQLPTMLPHTLSPTNLQLRTLHHPYLDVIASPSLRDNILIATLSGQQEDQLCIDLHTNGSIMVWGNHPWSSLGWEVSQEFADRWGWLLDGETIRTSNFWRMERGDVPLHIDIHLYC